MVGQLPCAVRQDLFGALEEAADVVFHRPAELDCYALPTESRLSSDTAVLGTIPLHTLVSASAYLPTR